MALQIHSCGEGETFVVTTRGSVYELIVLGDGDVLVRGGKHLKEFRRVRFLGSMGTEGPLEAGSVDIGRRMMFVLDERLFMSSAVELIVRPHAGSAQSGVQRHCHSARPAEHDEETESSSDPGEHKRACGLEPLSACSSM